jgi:hypothetical protein
MRNEGIYDDSSDIIKNLPSEKQGLIPAIEEFLQENSNWCVKETYTNNNGLTVLARK